MTPKAFMSHSSADKDIVRRLATDLRSKGVDVWFDEWEIRPGDSIVERINAGIKDCDIFIIVISRNSVASKWVREELDAALIRRIQEDARIIPVRLDDCEVPPLLSALHYVSIRSYAEGLKRLIDAIFEVDLRPPLGEAPTGATFAQENPYNLSDTAIRIGKRLFEQDDTGLPGKLFDIRVLLDSSGSSSTETEDAIHELEEYGFVEVRRYIGGALVGPTHRTPYALGRTIDYDPDQDILQIAKALISRLGWWSGPDLQQATGLEIPRINRGVRVLEDMDAIEVLKPLGTAPFGFRQVQANHVTRRFVREHE